MRENPQISQMTQILGAWLRAFLMRARGLSLQPLKREYPQISQMTQIF